MVVTFTLAHSLVMIVLALTSFACGDARIAATGGALSLLVYVWQGRPRWGARGGFGLANSVTALRIGLIALLSALPGVGPRSACLVLLVFVLDGVDGWLARRRRESSPFGAAFDMEADALLVLIAGLKLGVAGRLGPWILVPGLLRYVYAATISLLPSSRGEAPRSRLGRYGFSIVVTSFVVSLWPLHPLHRALAAVATTFLVVSFARSAFWSFGPRQRRLA